MKSDLALAFSRVTEGAALAAYQWLGRGDKNSADGAAVEVMRNLLNKIEIQGEIVIGEGEIDEAPMLYIGEKVGLGGDAIEIAVDPIEGTRMTAMGQSNAFAVLAAADKGTFLQAPDMYMEKLAVGAKAKGSVDLGLSLTENLGNIATALGKTVDQLVVITLAKERHDKAINQMQTMGAQVFAIPDGDVAASVLICLDESEVDVMYCIGGAPEGIVSAAVIRGLGGDMNGRLIPRHKVKGDTEANRKLGEDELIRCSKMGVKAETVLKLDDMVKSNDIIFSATGITKGDLLEGVSRNENIATTETLLIEGNNRTIRRIKSTHALDHQDQDIRLLIS